MCEIATRGTNCLVVSVIGQDRTALPACCSFSCKRYPYCVQLRRTCSVVTRIKRLLSGMFGASELGVSVSVSHSDS